MFFKSFAVSVKIILGHMTPGKRSFSLSVMANGKVNHNIICFRLFGHFWRGFLDESNYVTFNLKFTTEARVRGWCSYGKISAFQPFRTHSLAKFESLYDRFSSKANSNSAFHPSEVGI